MIEIQLNGEAKQFEGDIDVARLLDSLGLGSRKVAVERNGDIVPRSRFAETALIDGDRLEIVVAVGGG